MRVLLIQPRPDKGIGYKSVIMVEPLGLEIVAACPELVECLEKGGNLDEVPGLVLNTEQGQVSTPTRDLMPNLNLSPIPRRDLTASLRKNYFLGLRRPITTLETARGCPYRCTFCSIWNFYRGKVRFKSPERVLEEMLPLDAEHILITDDNFLADIGRAEKIASLILKSGMPRHKYIFQARSDTIIANIDIVKLWKEAGLDQVFIGFEKIEEEALDEVNKKNSVVNNEMAIKLLRDMGIGVYAAFIVNPDFTRLDFRKLLQYVRDHYIYQPQFSVLTPLPGTELFRQIKDLINVNNYEFFDLFHAVVPTKLPLKEFYSEFSRLYRRTYMRPKNIMENIGWFVKSLARRQISRTHLKRLLTGISMTSRVKSYMTPDPAACARAFSDSLEAKKQYLYPVREEF